MRDAKITRIPYPRIILKGDWSGIVYAITTDEGDIDRHKEAVEEAIESIENEFDEKNHISVSLREVKRELVWSNADLDMYCTLIELRIRDSY